jgi:uncharacterized phage protein (TIGR01671 family)
MREIKFRFWDGKKMTYHGYQEAECSFHGLLVCEGDTIPLQFTGLKDKNGKEIYEGDLLKYDEDIREVTFDDGMFNVGHVLAERYEVIGNIYENPNLLKGE